jgi:SAM-dependent methyltransferase
MTTSDNTFKRGNFIRRLDEAIRRRWKTLMSPSGSSTPLTYHSQTLAPAVAEHPAGATFLNIGGGPNFASAGWANLDGALPAGDPGYFDFEKLATGAKALPFSNNRFQVVYSSHCLEHLNDLTIAKLLPECHRVMDPCGSFVIKIPDFDRTIDAWKKEDAYKALFYCTDVNERMGSTEVELGDGTTLTVKASAGSFLFFDNNGLRRRGIAPIEPNARLNGRAILELTLIPYFRVESRPIFAGLNARYPKRPW